MIASSHGKVVEFNKQSCISLLNWPRTSLTRDSPLVEIFVNNGLHAVSFHLVFEILAQDESGCIPKVAHQLFLPGDVSMKYDGDAARMLEVAKRGAQVVPDAEGFQRRLVLSTPPTRYLYLLARRPNYQKALMQYANRMAHPSSSDSVT
jgi:hypothetical protein